MGITKNKLEQAQQQTYCLPKTRHPPTIDLSQLSEQSVDPTALKHSLMVGQNLSFGWRSGPRWGHCPLSKLVTSQMEANSPQRKQNFFVSS